jgi:hypothetical protein
MEKICVNLYGGKGLFGGKETPLRAETVFCDKADKCSLYKSGKCLNVTSPFSGRCKFGRVSTAQGYTSRAQKYHTFRSQYENDETYNKLGYPSNCKIALVDDYVFVNVVFSRLKENEQGHYCVTETGFGSGASWIPLDKFSTDIIYQICSYRAYAMMGGEIKDYRAKHIPEFLYQLSFLMPELYKQFIAEYPQYDIKPNHVGKYAYISTLNKNLPVIDTYGNKFSFDGDCLISDNYKPSFAPFKAEKMSVRIEITDKMTAKITDNAQVTSETIFEQ